MPPPPPPPPSYAPPPLPTTKPPPRGPLPPLSLQTNNSNSNHSSSNNIMPTPRNVSQFKTGANTPNVPITPRSPAPLYAPPPPPKNPPHLIVSKSTNNNNNNSSNINNNSMSSNTPTPMHTPRLAPTMVAPIAPAPPVQQINQPSPAQPPLPAIQKQPSIINPQMTTTTTTAAPISNQPLPPQGPAPQGPAPQGPAAEQRRLNIDYSTYFNTRASVSGARSGFVTAPRPPPRPLAPTPTAAESSTPRGGNSTGKWPQAQYFKSGNNNNNNNNNDSANSLETDKVQYSDGGINIVITSNSHFNHVGPVPTAPVAPQPPTPSATLNNDNIKLSPGSGEYPNTSLPSPPAPTGPPVMNNPNRNMQRQSVLPPPIPAEAIRRASVLAQQAPVAQQSQPTITTSTPPTNTNTNTTPTAPPNKPINHNMQRPSVIPPPPPPAALQRLSVIPQQPPPPQQQPNNTTNNNLIQRPSVIPQPPRGIEPQNSIQRPSVAGGQFNSLPPQRSSISVSAQQRQFNNNNNNNTNNNNNASTRLPTLATIQDDDAVSLFETSKDPTFANHTPWKITAPPPPQRPVAPPIPTVQTIGGGNIKQNPFIRGDQQQQQQQQQQNGASPRNQFNTTNRNIFGTNNTFGTHRSGNTTPGNIPRSIGGNNNLNNNNNNQNNQNNNPSFVYQTPQKLDAYNNQFTTSPFAAPGQSLVNKRDSQALQDIFKLTSAEVNFNNTSSQPAASVGGFNDIVEEISEDDDDDIDDDDDEYLDFSDSNQNSNNNSNIMIPTTTQEHNNNNISRDIDTKSVRTLEFSRFLNDDPSSPTFQPNTTTNNNNSANGLSSTPNLLRLPSRPAPTPPPATSGNFNTLTSHRTMNSVVTGGGGLGSTNNNSTTTTTSTPSNNNNNFGTNNNNNNSYQTPNRPARPVKQQASLMKMETLHFKSSDFSIVPPHTPAIPPKSPGGGSVSGFNGDNINLNSSSSASSSINGSFVMVPTNDNKSITSTNTKQSATTSQRTVVTNNEQVSADAHEATLAILFGTGLTRQTNDTNNKNDKNNNSNNNNNTFNTLSNKSNHSSLQPTSPGLPSRIGSKLTPSEFGTLTTSPSSLTALETAKYEEAVQKYKQELEQDARGEIDYGQYHGFTLPGGAQLDEKVVRLWSLAYAESRKTQQANWAYFEEQCFVASIPITTALRFTKPGRDLILDGIPIKQRAPIWAQLCCIDEMKRAFPNYYQDCLEQLQYKPTASAKDIAKDVKRTMQYHELFQSSEGLDILTNILSVFSFKYPKIGYTQSMNVLASTLMLFFNEHDAYCMFDHLLTNIIPQDFYTNNLIDVKTEIQVLVHYTRKRLPAIYRKISSLDIDLCAIVLPWFMCLYVEVLPLESAMRVWDILFVENHTAVLVRIAMLILYLNEKKILQCTNQQECLMLLMQAPGELLDCDSVIQLAHQGVCYLTRAQIDKNRKRYKKLIEKQYLNSLKYLQEGGGQRNGPPPTQAAIPMQGTSGILGNFSFFNR